MLEEILRQNPGRNSLRNQGTTACWKKLNFRFDKSNNHALHTSSLEMLDDSLKEQRTIGTRWKDIFERTTEVCTRAFRLLLPLRPLVHLSANVFTFTLLLHGNYVLGKLARFFVLRFLWWERNLIINFRQHHASFTKIQFLFLRSDLSLFRWLSIEKHKIFWQVFRKVNGLK